MTHSLIGYHFIHQDSLPQHYGSIRDYLIAGNGIFIRAERPDFSAIILVQSLLIPGLKSIAPRLTLRRPRISANLVTQMIGIANSPRPFVETLFYFHWSQDEWKLTVPSQIQTRNSVQPILSEASDNDYQTATIEVHSHPPNATTFSADDTQIATGFRIFAILADVDTVPKLITRVGIDGMFWSIPAHWVFEVSEF
ncbi:MULTISPECIES: hypothetical protein [Leptolyngbya]|jgi:hypothetical protein|uniref:JAB domain-containing protein n=1 Tax=Leptolyngbya boryana NIES-2135 TaxID=1973484 RepID=A0A1Z4JT12_LEPBY|nr:MULTISPECIES: hypothetical protein [Leptolyngbya]BAY59778.1 hypothetical protein NIES2135_66550 [Leptolyngbya boryana NIES-2135]MBD2370569.1 hypothetical protein [Leptolyngbya sp. FACHB-161]MBD2377047.1 hypothetical protein [Leptolyngbya sp. FACHB-238]MBD2401415.1 hypothetical protein [Leptolyngbya sp. FACHB-239]MBD2407966.1 hypothetical protein [Leptolyngbya sp. FACHB-402]